MFNDELGQTPPFRQLQNAAEKMWDRHGNHGMLEIIQERYTVDEITTDMTNLLSFPWQAIYTTNYDNALELAAQSAHKPFDDLNNTDDPSGRSRRLPIIHLHGYVKKWDIHNFRDSCVLDSDSYLRLTHVRRWLQQFQDDVDMAQLIVFVGFNAEDFHLNQAIYDLTGLKEKSFFINRPTAQPDPDVAATQERMGTPLYIGRQGLADQIVELLRQDAPEEPHLASFYRVTPADPATEVPTAKEIENLFIFGEVEPTQLARDRANRVSEYHIRRAVTDEALTSIESGKRVILFTGYPCDGKSLVLDDLAQRLLGARPVFKLFKPYATLLDEVAKILHYAPNSALVIENCFDLQVEQLQSIARQFDGKDCLLVLTSREVAVDASPVGLTMLEGLETFRQIPLSRLTEAEAQTLSDLIDQIAGWRFLPAHSTGNRLHYIMKVCRASLPHFLMRLLNSDYVTGRYTEEFNKLSLTETEREAIIIALLITHIGENAPVSFLSDAMQMDFGAVIDGLNQRPGNQVFRLVRRNAETVETVPSIGAQNILKTLFPDREVVNAVVPLLRNLATIYRNPFEQRMFSQMMRFSILSDVVTDREEIDRFFENNKQHDQIRRMPLFWLQWHMAKCDAKELTEAEKLLEQGYREAAQFERRTGKKFDNRQLDDRRAKFLMLRADAISREGAELFRDFKEACELTDRILRQEDPQRYPFETIKEIVKTYDATKHRLLDAHRNAVGQLINKCGQYSCQRLGILPDGFQKNKARESLQEAGFNPAR